LSKRASKTVISASRLPFRFSSTPPGIRSCFTSATARPPRKRWSSFWLLIGLAC